MNSKFLEHLTLLLIQNNDLLHRNKGMENHYVFKRILSRIGECCVIKMKNFYVCVFFFNYSFILFMFI